jgi:hypothetical protein
MMMENVSGKPMGQNKTEEGGLFSRVFDFFFSPDHPRLQLQEHAAPLATKSLLPQLPLPLRGRGEKRYSF